MTDKYPEPEVEIAKQFEAQLMHAYKQGPKTVAVAKVLYDLLRTAEIFGFVPEPVRLNQGSIFVTYRDMENCAAMLPLLELCDRAGFEAIGSTDYATVHNRDYDLLSPDPTVRIKLECYFTRGNCRKVPVGSNVEYRLECGSTVTMENQNDPA